MKTKILLIICSIILLSCKSLKNSIDCKNTTNSTQKIVYDFSKGEFDTSYIKPKQMIPTVFKIKKINPIFYKITIESDNKVISYENSDIQQIKDAASKLEKSSETFIPEKLIINTSYLSLPDKSNIDYSPALKNLIGQELKLEAEIKKLEAELKLQDEEDQNNSQKIIIGKKYELDLLHISIKQSLSESNKTEYYLTEIKKNVEKINRSYKEVMNSATEIQIIVNNYNNFIDKITIPDLDYEKFNTLKKCSASDNKSCFGNTVLLDKEKLNSFYGVNRYFYESYRNFLDVYNNFELKDNLFQLKSTSKEYTPIVDNILSEIERLRNSAAEVNDKITNFNLAGKLNNVEILVEKLSKEGNYEYVSAPIQGTEDYLEFDVKVENRYSNTEKYTFNSEKSFKHFEYLRKGVRFDFSVGTVFDFVNKDKEYEIQNNIIKQTSDNKFTPVLAGIFHASFRQTGNAAWGFSLGGALDVTNFNINSVFPGVSVLFGKKDKVIITVGPSFKKITELKANYKINEEVDPDVSIDNLKTNNFKIGMFVGISYNLTNRQKDLIKIVNK